MLPSQRLSLLSDKPGHLAKWNPPPLKLSGSPGSQLRVLGLDRSPGRGAGGIDTALSQGRAALLPEREGHDPKVRIRPPHHVHPIPRSKSLDLGA